MVVIHIAVWRPEFILVPVRAFVSMFICQPVIIPEVWQQLKSTWLLGFSALRGNSSQHVRDKRFSLSTKHNIGNQTGEIGHTLWSTAVFSSNIAFWPEGCLFANYKKNPTDITTTNTAAITEKRFWTLFFRSIKHKRKNWSSLPRLGQRTSYQCSKCSVALIERFPDCNFWQW